MRDDNYFVIYGWMLNKYNLTQSEVMVLAFIYAFENGFDGSLEYMATSTNMHKINAKKTVDKLIDKGLVIRETRKGKTSKYTVSKMLTHRKQNANGTVSKMLTNNNTNNNIYKLNSKQSSFNNFNQRSYNYSELENILRSN